MRPVYKFEVDWDGSGTFDGGAEDITAYVLSYGWRRGANPDTQILRRSEPGDLTIRLRNEDGRFSPFESGSPLAGDLLPGREVRVSCGVAAADHVRWTGRLETLTPQHGRAGPEVTLTAAGMLRQLQDKKIVTPAFRNETTGELMERILDYAGIGYQGVVAADNPLVHYRLGTLTEDLSSGSLYTPEVYGKGIPNGNYADGASLGILGATLVPGAIALDADRALAFDRPTGQIMLMPMWKSMVFAEQKPWSIEGWLKTADYAASPTRRPMFSTEDKTGLSPPYVASTEGIFCWVDTSGGVRRLSLERISEFGANTVTLAATSDTIVKDDEWMHIVATYDGATLSLYIDGELQDSAADSGSMLTTSEPIIIFPGPAWWRLTWAAHGSTRHSCSLDEIAVYEHALSAERVLAHYTAGITGYRRVETGESAVTVWWADEGEYAFEAARQIEDTEMGFLYEAADGMPVFEGRHHRLTAARSLTPQIELSDAQAATETFLLDATQEDPLKSVINEVKVDIPSFVIQTGPATMTVRPSGAGALAQWTVFGAATNWECVDEVVADGDATAVFINVPGATDFYALPDTVPPNTRISQVEVFIRAYGQFVSDAAVQIAVRSDGSPYYSDTKVLASSYADYSYVWALNPANNQAWTKQTVDALQAGVRFISASDAAFAVVTQLWMVITYEQPAPSLQWALGEDVRIAPGETVELWARAGSSGFVEHWDALTFPSDSSGLGGDTSIIRFRRDDGTFFAGLAGAFGLMREPRASMAFEQYAADLRIRVTNEEPVKYITLADWQMAGYAQEEGPTKQVSAENTESRRKYGPRTYPFPGRWVPNVATARSYCNEIVSAYGEPLPVLTVPVHANSDDTLFSALIDLELSDRITLVADNMHLKWGINRDFFIEAIAESMDFEEGQLLLTLTLSPIPEHHVFLIGTDVIGSGARIGF